MASRPDGDVWNIVDNDKDSQHYGRTLSLIFPIFQAKKSRTL